MFLTPTFLALMMAASVILIFTGLALPRPSDQVQARLGQYGTRPRTLEEIELQQPFTDRIIKPLIASMARFITRFAPQRNIEKIEHKLELAGNPNNWIAADFIGVRGLAALLAAALPFFFLLITRSPIPNLFLLTLLFGGLGFYLPVIWLGRKIRSRQAEIVKALPDVLDLLTISVEAGLGFDAAMAKVTEKGDNELSRGFARVIGEMRVGKPRQEALRDMSDRMGVPDVANFIAAIIQADQLGVSIARVLHIQSGQMRIKRRQRAEERAQKTPLKMLFPMVFLIFPSLFVVLLGPAVLTIARGGLFGR